MEHIAPPRLLVQAKYQQLLQLVAGLIGSEQSAGQLRVVRQDAGPETPRLGGVKMVLELPSLLLLTHKLF
jgi:hypothetical protein